MNPDIIRTGDAQNQFNPFNTIITECSIVSGFGRFFNLRSELVKLNEANFSFQNYW